MVKRSALMMVVTYPPFCGIRRPVLLYTMLPRGIHDIKAVTDNEDTTGIIKVSIKSSKHGRVRVKLTGYGKNMLHEGQSIDELTLRVPMAKFWHPDPPHLYDLLVEHLDDEKVVDSYSLRAQNR